MQPFEPRRYAKPVQVKISRPVKKIAAGWRHSFAIDDNGQLWGWGYNNQQQLSHSNELGNEDPKFILFEPHLITTNIEDKRVVHVACGKEFSVFVTED